MPNNGNVGSTSAVYNDVTRDNIRPLFDSIRSIISRAKFVAIDTEFTGLVLSNASRVFRLNTAEWVTRATDMKERYKAMANVAKTHALLSIGISVYSRRHVTVPGSFNVNNFNFTLQAQNSHLINPASMSFLAQNGFDLTKQAARGIRYFSGPNPDPVEVKTKEINEEGKMIREIFLDLVRLRKPLVIHNGLFDLVYLYQSFFGPLPDTYESFVYDLHEMFPGGIYDTKYIVESADPAAASFLAYAYHKSERVQNKRALGDEAALHIKLKNRLEYEHQEKAEPKSTAASSGTDTQGYCVDFAARGHCKLSQMCPLSHDVNYILDCQERESGGSSNPDNEADKETVENESNGNKKRKRSSADTNDDNGKAKKMIMDSGTEDTNTASNNGSTSVEANIDDEVLGSEKQIVFDDTSEIDDDDDDDDNDTSSSADSIDSTAPKTVVETMYHTAAYDAFMTGYVFASYQLLLQDMLDQYKNKVYLMGRSKPPLLVKASMYATNSVTYRQTISRVAEPEKADEKDSETPAMETKP
ncbi:hypothetical protein IW140_001496 [Coemansia sp. RSA 1813]|nr:hypothetical protein EV178_003266 [Coemansia sp. RSA 1646]KAJ1771568.1 hypothetical protein LPJ74_002256 [Coemansia sp. RSA 1843]KAJ2089572.1 hypothetical protein IW138_003314 [Coemansia sp. RSA 986]KAJ2214674.1 hypothetical protein EV179_002779 [Coemansia sp. RSA 487]KAJ2571578.1 hypothetical protein IW140_001496 [Coemansia sp. RSA 1813]